MNKSIACLKIQCVSVSPIEATCKTNGYVWPEVLSGVASSFNSFSLDSEATENLLIAYSAGISSGSNAQ